MLFEYSERGDDEYWHIIIRNIWFLGGCVFLCELHSGYVEWLGLEFHNDDEKFNITFVYIWYMCTVVLMTRIIYLAVLMVDVYLHIRSNISSIL